MEGESDEELRAQELELNSLRQLSNQLSQLHCTPQEETEAQLLFQAVVQLRRQLEEKLDDLRSLLTEEKLLEKKLKVNNCF